MILYELQDSHQGIEEMTHVARSNIYWPGIDADIADYVRCCSICAKHKASQAVQPILPNDIPDGPWQELALDYFIHFGKDYLLITDPFSKYPFIFKVHSKTSDSITNHLQDLFSQYGTPRCFYSLTMDLHSLQNLSPPFSHLLALTTITPSALNTKSSGFIDWQIKTIKTSLTIAQSSGFCNDHLLQTLLFTPIGSNLPSLPWDTFKLHRLQTW